MNILNMELIESCEVYNGDFEYLYTACSYSDENDNLHLVHHKDRKRSDEGIHIKINLDDIYSKISKHKDFKVYNGDMDNVYVKRPSVLSYEIGDDSIKRFMINEIECLEKFTIKSHPNICEYLGCKVKDDYIVGIYLRKYDKRLDVALNEGVRLDVVKILSQIISGIDFIHSEGFVHDDLNPRNIMLDDDMNAIIIDFDSCKKIGSSRKDVKSGTIDWDLESDDCSIKNDVYNLGLLTKYIIRKCTNIKIT